MTIISCLIIAGLLSIPLVIRVRARDSRPRVPKAPPSPSTDPRRGQIWSYRTPEGELAETGPLIEVTDASVGWLDVSCAWCVLGRDWLVCFLRDECSEETGKGFPGGRVEHVSPSAGPERLDLSSPYPESMRSHVPSVGGLLEGAGSVLDIGGVAEPMEDLDDLLDESSPYHPVNQLRMNSLYGKFGAKSKKG